MYRHLSRHGEELSRGIGIRMSDWKMVKRIIRLPRSKRRHHMQLLGSSLLSKSRREVRCLGKCVYADWDVGSLVDTVDLDLIMSMSIDDLRYRFLTS